jgi:preprotein translocase subunit SecE
MAKIVSDKSAGTVAKAQTKAVGGLRGALSRSSSRAAARPASTAAPRGAVSTKPHGRIRTFFREVRIELGKVTWPPRKELLQATGVVIVAVIIAGVYIGLFDFIWNLIVRAVGMG